MRTIFKIFFYSICFDKGKAEEPFHVLVYKKDDSNIRLTKIGLYADKSVKVVGDTNISDLDLYKILKFISCNFSWIEKEWLRIFKEYELKYYN